MIDIKKKEPSWKVAVDWVRPQRCLQQQWNETYLTLMSTEWFFFCRLCESLWFRIWISMVLSGSKIIFLCWIMNGTSTSFFHCQPTVPKGRVYIDCPPPIVPEGPQKKWPWIRGSNNLGQTHKPYCGLVVYRPIEPSWWSSLFPRLHHHVG